MKAAIITDIHYGIRQDSQVFHDNYKSFLDNIFFPTLQSQQIDTIFMLGDLVERRQSINVQTAKRLREDFLEKSASYNNYYIVGNHDCYYNNTNQVNSLRELLQEENFNLYIDPTEIEIAGHKVLLLPWICSDNHDRSMNLIDTTTAQICFGHLTIQGFEMYRGQYSEEGLNRSIFDKFDVVATGHFHHKSSRGNIHYLGAATYQTWHDWEDPRGFHIFDFDTRSFEFIMNPYEMFKKVVYDDTNQDQTYISQWDFNAFIDTYVKIIVKNKSNPYIFDMFFNELEEVALDVKKIEERIFIEDTVDSDDCENTIQILQKTIQELPDAVNKQQLESFMIELYNEAQKIEV